LRQVGHLLRTMIECLCIYFPWNHVLFTYRERWE